MRRSEAWRLILLTWAVVLAFGLSPAQVVPDRGPAGISHGGWLTRRWTTQDGLPGNIVPALLQSRSGRVWIGTLDGLTWSDGLAVYPVRPRDYPGAPEGGIWSLVEDLDGTLWIGGHNGRIHRLREGRYEDVTPPDIGTFNISLGKAGDGGLWAGSPQGLWRWDGSRWARPPGEAGAFRADIKSLAGASRGGLWLGTRDQGIWRLEGTGSLRQIPWPEATGVDEISKVLEDPGGRLWVGTRGRGLYYLEEERLHPVAGLPRDLQIETLAWGRDGVAWVGTNIGVYRVNAEGATLFEASVFGRYARIPSLIEDREGTLWVGTWQDGLVNLRRAALEVTGPEQGLVGGVFSLTPRRDGGVWVSSNQGEVRLFHDNALRLVPGLGDRLPGEAVGKDLLEDHRGNLWIGTGKGLLRFRAGVLTHVPLPGPAPTPITRAFHESPDGSVWVGTQQGLFRMQDDRWTAYTQADGLTNTYILSIQSDRDGRLLVGTNGGGLCILERGRFRALRRAEGLPSDIVFRGHQTPDGAWWFGSTGGLFRMTQNRIQDFSKLKEVLPLTVYQVLEDRDGALWITSSRSVVRLDPRQAAGFLEGEEVRLRTEIYDERDGLPTGGPTSVGHSIVVGDELLVATTGGVVRIQPRRLRAATSQPKVEVLEIRAPNGIHPARDGVRVPSRSDIEIRYAAHTAVGPERTGFRYLLEGFDREWQLAGDRRAAFFTHVPPGTYRFRVMAGQGDAAWQEAPPLTFVVVPRWFERPLVQGAGLLALALAVWGTLRWRHRALRQRALDLEALVAQRTHDLSQAKSALEVANQALESKVADRTRELRDALQRALAADEAKGLLLARMSHEFRTPLNHILLYAELLRQEWPEGNPRPDQDFQHIHASGKALEALLGDLLDYAELATGGLRLRRAPFSLQVLLDGLRQQVAPQARAKGLAFNLIGRELPAELVGDEARVAQVLRDLTTNAVKFTPQGEVVVEATWLPEARRLRVRVEDTGPGLPLERRTRPFEALEPGDGSLTRRHPGTGLGLALAHGLVALMGGDLAWQDRPGGGTIFTVELPLETA